MLIVPYIRVLIFGLLAASVPLVDAKGSKSKSKVNKAVIHKDGSTHTECINAETQQVVACPKDNKAAIIAGAVVGSVVGLLLIAGLIYWFVLRPRRNKSQKAVSAAAPSDIAPGEKKELESVDSNPELSKPKPEGTV